MPFREGLKGRCEECRKALEIRAILKLSALAYMYVET